MIVFKERWEWQWFEIKATERFASIQLDIQPEPNLDYKKNRIFPKLQIGRFHIKEKLGIRTKQSRDKALLDELLPADMIQKLTNFDISKKNPNARECRKCKKMNIGNSMNPSIQCECGAIYCFYHDVAHVNGTCEDYARRVQRVDLASQAAIKASTSLYM
jgi:hypothetical protein